MKNVFVLFLILVAAFQVSSAQTTVASGTVNDDKGTPLHYVFVTDVSYKNAVFTDSLGNFTIDIHPDSQLQFDLAGYAPATVSPAKSGALKIVLKADASGGPSDKISNIDAHITTTSNSSNPDATIGDGGYIAPGHQKGKLKGNLYLFDTFVHGFIISPGGEIKYDPNNLYAYDKIAGVFLVTRDKKAITQLNDDQFKSIILYSNTDVRFVFERVPGIDASHFVQVLASGTKYKIYKLTKTKFVRSDYVNTGLTSHGNDYDEYVDDADYYVLDVLGNKMQKLSLRKKSLKEDFAKDADRLNKFLSDNSSRIDDNYLSTLGDYMNQ